MLTDDQREEEALALVRVGDYRAARIMAQGMTNRVRRLALINQVITPAAWRRLTGGRSAANERPPDRPPSQVF
jgi:hypothetical protein